MDMKKYMAIVVAALTVAACTNAPEEGTPDEPTDAVTEPMTQLEAEKLWVEAGGDPVPETAPAAPLLPDDVSAEEKRLERKANAEDRANSVK